MCLCVREGGGGGGGAGYVWGWEDCVVMCVLSTKEAVESTKILEILMGITFGLEKETGKFSLGEMSYKTL